MSSSTTKINIRRENGEVVSQYALGTGEHVIGRESGSDIFIEDDFISRQHAKLIISADAIEIEDLKSTSGTFLDGMAIRGRITVMPGQKVHISDLYMDIERAGLGELIKGARLGKGRFTLVEKLGQGGMGAVWKALDEESGEHVALKFLPPEMGINSSGLDDLKREVEKTKHLKHPNIVQIGGLRHTEGEAAFITVEYVEGTNLDELRPTKSHNLLPWASVQHYMLQLCDALEYAHSKRIAHRDIKPSNLLINRSGQLKLADFGIAASIASTTSNFTTNVLGAGTPSYMSPQQINGNSPQPSDDIYSLGSTFYDLLTGKPPFYQGQVVHQVLNARAIPMADRLKKLKATNDIPDYVAAMVMSCLQKDPNKRPKSAAAIGKWIVSKGKKVDLSKGDRMIWNEEAENQTPPSSSEALDQANPTIEGDSITREKKPKVLAYGVAALIVAVSFTICEPCNSALEKGNETKKISPADTLENSLGMKFVPVPGTKVAFCIWETRVKDYMPFAAANKGVNTDWKRPGILSKDTHPVNHISWNDANAFCTWLTKKELAAGKLKAGQRYRLPTDAEWSVAVGLGKENGNTPQEKNKRIKGVYPWGKDWPPPDTAGNYHNSLKDDGFENTSPVGSFKANAFGIHDLGGNVWEWCEDWYDPELPERVLRGASWGIGTPESLLSSYRSRSQPNQVLYHTGFRCVLTGQ